MNAQPKTTDEVMVSGCQITGGSSRVCEHGQKSCEIRHDQPKSKIHSLPAVAGGEPTGEWTVEENGYGTTLNLHNGGGSSVSLPIGRPWFVFATMIADVHNAALAAERERVTQMFENQIPEALKLREQLAAEREKVTLSNQMVGIESRRANELEAAQQPLAECLNHLIHSNHVFSPDGCHGCAQAQRIAMGKESK